MVRRIVLKGLVTLALLGMSGGLLWYGTWTNRIAAKDFEFELKSSSGNLFSEVLFLKGNYEYFVDLDLKTASGYFRKAIATNLLLIDAWFALAKVKVVEGNMEEAWRICDTLLPLISNVSTWKWQELLLAFDLRDENRFVASLNFILSRLPYRQYEAFLLARAFWQGWAGVLPHITAENRSLFFAQLMRFREVDLAYGMWNTAKENGESFDKDLQLLFCQFLLENGRVKEAKDVWHELVGESTPGIYDGGFEREPLNSAFGWRFGKNPAVVIERTRESCVSGSRCLHIHFNGTQNVGFNHVSQTFPVEPGKTVRLQFARSSRGITSDKGVFLEVAGYSCGGLRVESPAVTGTTPWTEEELDIPVPDGCEALTVRVCRKESLMFDNKISGDYWLSGLVLKY